MTLCDITIDWPYNLAGHTSLANPDVQPGTSGAVSQSERSKFDRREIKVNM